MAAATINLIIEIGASYSHGFTWLEPGPDPNNPADPAGSPIDLTGYTARMEIRSQITSDIVLLDLTTENNLLVITPLEGLTEIELTASDIGDITEFSGVYDLELESDTGYIKRLTEGTVTFSQEVTRT